MSRWQWLPALVAALMVGCATPTEPARSTSWLNPFRPATSLAGADLVQMDVALIERPVGDRYINRDLWALADEGGITWNRIAALDDNGVQIGQVGGIIPPGLQTLLTSERSCVNPRRITLRSGHAYDLMLGPPHRQLHFQTEKDGEAALVAFDQAQCVLVVTPTLTSDGRTLLRCTPQVRHGQVQHVPRPAADLSGWVLQAQQATETYTDWSFEVSLATNEYLVIGGRLDRPGSFGQQCFVRRDEPAPVQRLLVIRTGRMPPSVASVAASHDQEQGVP